MSIEVLLSSLLVALAVALASWFSREYALEALAYVEKDLADKLRRLHAPTRRLRSYLLAWLALAVAAAMVLTLALDSPVFGLFAAAFLLAAPWYLVRRMAERRRQRIEDQLPDAMVALANAVRAGLSLAQSLEILAAQCPWPIRAEFGQIVAEYKLGKPLDRTLTEAKRRLRSENFALFSAAIQASHESGGRLNETVERIATSVLELQRLERKVKSETAQARKSAVYMAIAPAAILVAWWFVDPENTAMLFTKPAGQFLLGVAAVLDVVAYVWAQAILNPDI